MHSDNSDYPNEIDLGRKVSDMGINVPIAPRGTKGKSRKEYPKLYIDDAPADLKDLPADGCVMIKYHRERLSVDTPSEGDDKTGMTLEIRSICLPEDMGDEGDDMESAMKEFAKGNGVDTGKDDDDGEETDDEDED